MQLHPLTSGTHRQPMEAQKGLCVDMIALLREEPLKTVKTDQNGK